MAEKKVTRKKTRTTAAGTRAPATKKSKKNTSTTRKTKTTRKPAAKVAKKPSKKKKKTAATVTKKPVKKKTIRAPKAVVTTSRKKKPTTTAKAGAGSRKTTSKGTSRSTSRPRLRSAASIRPSPDANGYVIINGRRVRMMSVPAEPVPTTTRRRRSRTKPNPDLEPIGRRKPSIVKTKLGRKDLENYRAQLLIRRAELVGDLSAMEAQALRSGGGNPSHMPIHMADVGTDTFDQDFMLGMAENERQRLREIDAALKRIEDRTYGICEMTHKVIPKSRLNAKPWARYTIESAREVERGLGE